MKKKLIIILLVVISFVGGGTYYFSFHKFSKLVEKHVNLKEGESSSIVLVNIGNGDREYIANVITKLAKYEPKVIGIDAFFKERKDILKDSLLKASFSNTNVVLGVKTFGTQLTGTDDYFLKNADNIGVAMLLKNDNYASSFDLSIKTTRGKINHISLVLATFLNPSKAKEFETKNSNRVPIIISKFKNQFYTYEYGNLQFSHDIIKNKIVLLGYLGPEPEDKFWTYSRYAKENPELSPSKADMYGCTIIANQIIQILD